MSNKVNSLKVEFIKEIENLLEERKDIEGRKRFDAEKLERERLANQNNEEDK